MLIDCLILSALIIWAFWLGHSAGYEKAMTEQVAEDALTILTSPAETLPTVPHGDLFAAHAQRRARPLRDESNHPFNRAVRGEL